MGLLTKLFDNASDSEFKLAQDLVAIAVADGEISPTERQLIMDICQREDISRATVTDCMIGNDPEMRSVIPANHRDKTDYLAKLIRVMGVDGHCSHLEIYLLEIIASKMGISHMELLSLVLSTSSRAYFSGSTGARVLSSFVKNAIDPNGNDLCTNHENLRKLFDMMFENVPQFQSDEPDETVFVQSMNTATSLLLENTNLCDEFRTMGIDFETVLMDEREQAIRRWIPSLDSPLLLTNK